MASGSTTPGTVPIEYTRGSGAFFPAYSTQATTSGLASAIQTINGQSASALNIVAGPSTGATVNITTQPSAPGQIGIGVSVTPQPNVAGVGIAYPASPVNGQLFYRTDLGHLYCFIASTSTWSQA